MTRKAFVAAGAFVALGLAASGSAAAESKHYKFNVIVHDGSTSFYAPVINGMNIACAQIGAECKFLGPPNGSDIPAEVDLIENAINSGIDAVIMDIPDEKAMQKVTAEADAKNVGVYFIGTAYPKTKYGSIGQDFYTAGKSEGNQIVKYLPDGGKIAIVTCCAGNVPLGLRAKGAMDAVTATGKFQIVGPTVISTDETQAYGAIESLYQANSDLKGIFGTDAMTSIIGRFIQKNGLKGKVMGGGFDLVPATISAIKSGDLQFTTGQNPFLWGYLAVHQMWLLKEHGVQPINVDSGADTVDASRAGNVDPQFH